MAEPLVTAPAAAQAAPAGGRHAAGNPADATLFQFSPVECDPSARRVAPGSDQLAQLSEQAWEEGYAHGREQGIAEGRDLGLNEVREQAAALSAIVGELAAPLASLDEELVAEIARLALQIARQVVRREIQTEPGEVVGAVREALRVLPFADEEIILWLHPEDVPLVTEALNAAGSLGRWRCEPDPSIERGGCVAETATSRVDNSVDARIAAVASTLFGGERESDAGSMEPTGDA